MIERVDLTKPSAAALEDAAEESLGESGLGWVRRDARSITITQPVLAVRRNLPGLTTVSDEGVSRVCTVRDGAHPKWVERQRVKRNEWNLRIANAKYRESKRRVEEREEDDRRQVLKDPTILRAWKELEPRERLWAMRIGLAMGTQAAFRP